MMMMPLNGQTICATAGALDDSYLISKSVLGLGDHNSGSPSSDSSDESEPKSLENSDPYIGGYSQTPTDEIRLDRHNFVDDSYRQAVKLFLNRKFIQCHDTLKPILQYCEGEAIFGQSPSNGGVVTPTTPRALCIRVWNLYLALFDVAAKLARSDNECESKEDPMSEDSWTKLESLEFVAMINDHRVWDFIINDVCQRLINVPAGIMVALTLLSLRYGADFNQYPDDTTIGSCVVKLDKSYVAGKLEEYIAHTNIRRNANSHFIDQNTPIAEEERDALRRLLNIYILQVLPNLNEFEYARKFIYSNRTLILATEKNSAHENDNDDNTVIQTLIESLESVEQEIIDRRDQKKREMAELKQRKLKKKLNKTQSKSSPVQSQSQPTTVTPSVPVQQQELTNKTTADFTPQGPLDLLMGFKRSLVQRITGSKPSSVITTSPTRRGISIVYKLSVLIFLVSITLNKNYRQKLNQILVKLWARLMHTVHMGTKVSYV